MIAQSSDQSGITSKATKRPLFNKPAWANAGSGVEGDLFHRSAHSYVDSAAEIERKLHRQTARREKDKLRTSISGKCSPKRRRISDGEEDDDTAESDLNSDQSSNRKETSRVARQTQSPSLKSTLVQQYQTQIEAGRAAEQKNRKARQADVIDLEDDSASENSMPVSVHMEAEIRPIKLSKPIEEDIPREEEFPELARKAREKARRKRLEQEYLSSSQIQRPFCNDEHLSVSNFSQQATLPLPSLEPTLHILITSAIENTKALIVNRKLSQRLKDVRLAWAERQGFGKDFTETVFLTWKGKRLFDVTSCRSLGITVDANGFIVYKGDVLGDEEGRLHMEAMTLEIFKKLKRAKEDKQAREENEFVEDEGNLHAPTKAEPQVRIILRGKGFDDFKLIVKPVSGHTLARFP